MRVPQSNGITHSQTTSSVEQASAGTNGAGTELDALFAKLIPPSVSAPLPTGPSTGPASGKSVHDLFAALGGNDMSRSVPPPQPSAPLPEPTPPRGIALLNTIFASATPSTSSTSIGSFATPTQAPPHAPPRTEEITIVSPKPTSSALPQILNQDVIHSLLGLGPDSRASSAAPSSVGSRRSNPNRYEGDNEHSEGEPGPNGVTSRSRTGDRRANGRTAGIPTFSVQNAASSESEADDVGRPSSSRRVPGDVTPRPPAGGLRLPPTSPPAFQQQQTSAPSASLSAPNLTGPNGTSGPDTPRERNLVPFEASSELWPYPRAPLDDRSFENEDVVELDFSDTRALSDPAVFSARLKDKQQKKKGRKSRKERDEENDRVRAEIEKGWDMPAQGHGQPSYPPTAKTAAAAMAPQNGAPAFAPVNGAAADSTPKQTKKAVVNGSSEARAPRTNGQSTNGALDGLSAKEAILAAISQKNVAPEAMVSRTEFVRELLTLIHVSALLRIYVAQC